MKIQNIRAVFPFKDYVIDTVKFGGQGAQVHLRRHARKPFKCSCCGSKMHKSRTRTQVAHDLACGSCTTVWIYYPATQAKCPRCGKYETFIPAEISAPRQATWRLMRHVSLLARHMPLEHIPEATGQACSHSSAYRWDRAILEKELPPPNLDGIRALLVDEKAVRRGHGYVTVVMDADTGEPLFVGEGKKKSTLAAFFELLSPSQKASIKAVCIDRAGSYRQAVLEHLPHAEIVYDKFHLTANLNAAVDEVRRQEWRAAEEAGAKELVKNSRYLLLRHEENVPEEKRKKLRDLLAANAHISAAHILKESFRLLWTYRNAACAEKFLRTWCGWVQESGLAAMCKFAAGIERDIAGVLAYFRHRITTSPLESLNNTIARVMHRSCGIRPLDYLFLRLRQNHRLQN